MAGPLWLPSARAQSDTRPIDPVQPIERNLEQRRVERQQASRDEIALPAGRASQNPAGGAETALFKLAAVKIEGAGPLPADEVAAVYKPRLGQPISQSGLSALASEISALHRAAGYHLTRAVIPPQDIRNGVVTIRIITGTISELEIKGDEAGRFGTRRVLAPIIAETPARIATLERQLLLVNDIPGVRVKDTTLDEIGSGSGRFRLTVILESWSVFVSAGLDNGASNAVGPWQAYFGAALNSLIVPGDSLALNLSSVPGSSQELRYGRLGYEAPLGNDWLRLGASVSRSLVRPGDRRRFDDVRSDARTVEVHATAVAVQTQRQTLSLSAGLAFSDVAEESVFGLGYRDRLRIASLTLDYRLRDDWQANTYATVSLRRGLGVDGASRRYDPFLSRTDGSGDFTLLQAAATRYQPLGADWSMKLAGSAQLSSEALLISQQFYLGGAAFGRAFQSGWLAGDNGVAGSAELRYDYRPAGDVVKNIQFFGFVEGGAVRSYGEPKDRVQSLSAAGGGVRVQLNDAVEAGVTVAAPLSFHSPSKGGRGATVLFSLTTVLKACPEGGGWRCA